MTHKAHKYQYTLGVVVVVSLLSYCCFLLPWKPASSSSSSLRDPVWAVTGPRLPGRRVVAVSLIYRHHWPSLSVGRGAASRAVSLMAAGDWLETRRAGASLRDHLHRSPFAPPSVRNHGSWRLLVPFKSIKVKRISCWSLCWSRFTIKLCVFKKLLHTEFGWFSFFTVLMKWLLSENQTCTCPAALMVYCLFLLLSASLLNLFTQHELILHAAGSTANKL